jgi:hypothetical protein
MVTETKKFESTNKKNSVSGNKERQITKKNLHGRTVRARIKQLKHPV